MSLNQQITNQTVTLGLRLDCLALLFIAGAVTSALDVCNVTVTCTLDLALTHRARRSKQATKFIMDLVDVTNICNGPIIDLIRWLQGRRLLANPLRCLPCNQGMDLVERGRQHVDGYQW